MAMKDTIKEMNVSLSECQKKNTASWDKNMPADEREGVATVLKGVAWTKEHHGTA
jgi:hypothetical protein